MKLHGNAELSLNKRRSLVARVAGGWTLTKAAEAAEVSVQALRRRPLALHRPPHRCRRQATRSRLGGNNLLGPYT
jgi:hypothetical protein